MRMVDLPLESSSRHPQRLGARVMSAVTAGRLVWATTIIASAGWSAVAIARESLFLDTRYNLGNFTQAVWATAHGHFLRVTEIGGAEVSRLGIHVDPIVAFFAPFWWLWPSPKLLLLFQAVALALGAIPLFWLGRKHLPRESDAALLAVAYLLSPTVAWNATTAFSAVAFAVPLLLFAVWYLDEGRLLAFAAAAGSAALCQEQVGLIVACLGLWYAWHSKRLRVGTAIAAAGFAISAIAFLVVLRHFSGGSPYAARFGGSATGIGRDLFTHPLSLAHQVNTHDLWGLLIAVPVLGFCLESTILLAAIPQIALLVLSRRQVDWNWFGVNVLLLIPFVYAAAVYALGRRPRRSGEGTPMFAAGAIFATSLALAVVVFGPLGIARGRLFPPQPALSAQRHAVGLIPAHASVSATNHLALPLAARRYLYVFPVRKNADWVVVDSRDADLPDMSYLRRRVGIKVGVNDLDWQPRLMRRELRALGRSPEWQLVYRRDGIYVFRQNVPKERASALRAHRVRKRRPAKPCPTRTRRWCA